MEFKRFHCVKKNHVISLRLTEATEWVALVVINPLQCRRRKRCEFGPYIGRTWQPTPVFLPEKFHEQRRLAGCRWWGCKESNMTEPAGGK